MTSSKMRSAPCRRQRLWAVFRKPGLAVRPPCRPRPAPGSTQAIRRRCVERLFQCFESLNSKTSVSAVQPAGTPGEGGAVRHRTTAGFDEQAVDMAVIAAGEVDDPLAAGETTCHAQTLIVASVPELTIRTCSIEGTASTISSASSASASVGAASWSFRQRPLPRRQRPRDGNAPRSAAPTSRRNRAGGCRRRRRGRLPRLAR